MRNLFVIGMLLMGAFMAGWFHVNREGDRTTIEINRDEIRSDTRRAIDRGREILDRQQQQYADQQQYAPQNQQWPQEQVAAQQQQWGQVQQQSYQAPRYDDPNQYSQDQRLQNQQLGQGGYAPQQQQQQQSQQYYSPITR